MSFILWLDLWHIYCVGTQPGLWTGGHVPAAVQWLAQVIECYVPAAACKLVTIWAVSLHVHSVG